MTSLSPCFTHAACPVTPRFCCRSTFCTGLAWAYWQDSRTNGLPQWSPVAAQLNQPLNFTFKAIMFRAFPTSRSQWLSAGLFPFQAYVGVAYFVEQYFIRSLPGNGGYRG